MSETLYKVLNADGSACHGGSGVWNRRGGWMPAIADIVPCERGYHLCRERDLTGWLGPVIWEAVARGERIDCEDKIVVSEARLVRRVKTWTERTARLFACDCAERALPIYARFAPDDKRPAESVRIARLFADGKAAREEMAAAGAAAWDAAGDAAWDAAGAAAWAAAGAAARDAAWAAAGDAARAAAWDAAGAAARDAAWDAAGDAARAAERVWQTQRLMQYLRGEE